MGKVQIIEDSTPPSPPSQSTGRDELAYLAPMAAFLALTWVGGQWKSLYPASYVLKTLLAAGLLWWFWGHYTKIRWTSLGWGLAIGALVVLQWVGMETLILRAWPDYPRLAKPDVFDPFAHFSEPWQAWAFIAIRWAGASLVVPVMEELFWRDFLWRSIVRPGDFKAAPVGQWNVKAFIVVAIVFGAGVHNEWLTATVCGVIYGGLLVWTRSLGACIVAHGVTNFLLGGYVLIWRDWKFW